MSRYSDTKLALKTLLESISGIGKVFDYRPYVNDWNTFFDQFVENDLVKVVWLNPSSASEQAATPQGSSDASGFINVVEQKERWLIEAHFGHDEDTVSEYLFNEWRESIEDKFRFQQNITTGLSVNYYSLPLQRNYNGLFTFTGGLMVHRCEWTLEIVNRIINPN